MVGKNLSHYKILEELGRGGMGIVYKGEDTKLQRTVAIKVLPASALSNEDDRARFYREARAAASLTHPNIAVIHEIDEAVPEGAKDDDQRPFIAMEFIEGDTLEDRIKKGPMKLEDAIRIASEIAEGLKAAHAKDIVHRDIKAANVMLDGEGRAKILDFGLAQTAQSTKLTRMGSTLGTVAYMSPEQARGEEVDARTDIWALGVTLYEMIAGGHPFGGDYEQAVVYSIINEDPEPLTSLRTGVPMELERIAMKCVAKQARSRYQSVTDLIVDLENLAVLASRQSKSLNSTSIENVSTRTTSQDSKSSPTFNAALRKSWPIMASSVLLALLLGYILFAFSAPDQPELPPLKIPIHLEGISFVHSLDISPDGTQIAFAGKDSLGTSGLYVYDLREGSPRLIKNTVGSLYPVFSPKGDRLAFSMQGVVHTVQLPTGVPAPTTWSDYPTIWQSDEIIFGFDFASYGSWRANLTSGKREPFAAPDSPDTLQVNRFLLSISDDSKLGFGNLEYDNATDPSYLVIDLENGATLVGDKGIINPRYVRGGFVLYQLGFNSGPYLVRAIDEKTGQFIDKPAEVLPEISFFGVAVGADGSLVFAPDQFNVTIGSVDLFLFDLESGEKVRLGIPETENERAVRPTFSPDGKQIVYHITLASNEHDNHVEIFDLETSQKTVRTNSGNRRDPVWSHDGTTLYFDAPGKTESGIYAQSVNTPLQEELVVGNGAAQPSLSGDDRYLAFSRAYDVYMIDLESKNEIPVDTSVGVQWLPAVSPDGKFVAYESNALGNSSIMIKEIGSSPGSPGVPVGRSNGSKPVWAPDGNSLYYVGDDDGWIYQIRVTTESGIRQVGSPDSIVQVRSQDRVIWLDVHPDGNRLVISGNELSTTGFESAKRPTSTTIWWWPNWAHTLERE